MAMKKENNNFKISPSSQREKNAGLKGSSLIGQTDNSLVKESKISKVKLVRDQIKQLEYLAAHYDPYEENPPNEIKSLLIAFKIEENPDNPFYIQNQILILLDGAHKILQKMLH